MSIEQNEPSSSLGGEDIIGQEVARFLADEDIATFEPVVEKGPLSQLSYYIERTDFDELRLKLLGKLANRRP